VEVNEDQPGRLIELIQRHHPRLAGLSVSVLGVAFKPGTDDIRESPALPVLDRLLSGGAKVTVFDPIATPPLQAAYAGRPITYARALSEALAGAEVVVLMTRWAEFQEVPRLIAGRTPPPLVVDGRRMLDKQSVECYEGIGLRKG
jgi:UDPglucose 6-dehydrogenase